MKGESKMVIFMVMKSTWMKKDKEDTNYTNLEDYECIGVFDTMEKALSAYVKDRSKEKSKAVRVIDEDVFSMTLKDIISEVLLSYDIHAMEMNKEEM